MPVSINNSRISFNRQVLLFIRYSLSPLLYTFRVICTSSASIGSALAPSPLEFEISKLTSAVPAAFLLLLPLNITSAICPLRRLLALCSPSTHFTASTTLLLPQPFGPTIAVMGESKVNSILSAKLLNPSRVIFSSLISSLLMFVSVHRNSRGPHAFFGPVRTIYYRPMVCCFLIIRSISGGGPARNSARTAPLSLIFFKSAIASAYETPRPT